MGAGAAEALEGATPGSCVGVGLLFGALHVLTGPDHLAALATLASGSRWRAAALGARWGAGHACGLGVVAAIFFALHRRLDLDAVSAVADKRVGVMMVLLGVVALANVARLWHRRQRDAEHLADAACSGVPAAPNELKDAELAQQGAAHPSVEDARVVLLVRSGTVEHCEAHELEMPHIHVAEHDDSDHHDNHSCEAEGGEAGLAAPAKGSEPPACAARLPYVRGDDDIAPLLADGDAPSVPATAWVVDLTKPQTQRVTSVLVGVVHGVSGPSGALGVLPAVVLSDALRAGLYLASFFASSIAAMALFAALFGELTYRLGSADRSLRVGMALNVVAACASLSVGVAWLVLSTQGKLDL